MKARSVQIWLALASAALVGLAAPATPKSAPAPDRLDTALGKYIRGETPLDELEIEASWSTGAFGSATINLYGSGVVICNDSLQFSVKKDELVGVLRDLRAARFSSMLPAYGASGEDNRYVGPEGNEEENEPRLRGAIEVRAGFLTKGVQQFWSGSTSAELEALAKKILGVCREPAPEGTRVATVTEGLEKLDSGALAPEALRVMLRRRAEGPHAASAASWVLKLRGRRVTDQLLPAGHRTPPPKLLVLSEADLHAVVRLLAEERITTEIPTYVFQPQHTEFQVTVLNRMRLITGRKNPKLTAAVEKQKAFDRIYGALYALHERVQKKGKTVPSEARETKHENETEREREQKEKD